MDGKKRTESWVIYQMAIRTKPGHLNAVCEQREWDEMELTAPGFYCLLKAGILNEGEAEAMARNEQGQGIPESDSLKIPRS